MRKHEQIVAEEAQEAALNTEAKQEANHKLNENESALYSKTNKGRRNEVVMEKVVVEEKETIYQTAMAKQPLLSWQGWWQRLQTQQ